MYYYRSSAVTFNKSQQKDLPLGKQGSCTNNNNMQIHHLWYKCGSTFDRISMVKRIRFP